MNDVWSVYARFVTMVPVKDLGDERLKSYLAVSDPTLATHAGVFIAEGRIVVERLIRLKRHSLQSLLLSPSAFTALSPLLSELDPDIPVFVAELREFERITGFNLHRGCLAIAERPALPAPASLIASARLVVVLESVTDADNVGGIFRNAAAFLADAVLLSGASCDPLYRKAIRTSMAATLAVPYARYDDWASVRGLLRDSRLTVVSMSPRAALSVDDFVAGLKPDDRIALVLGTEGRGLSDAVRQTSDVDVRIPVSPLVDSLNVSVAAGIVLSRLARF